MEGINVSKKVLWILGILAVLLVGGCSVRVFFFTYVEPHQIAYEYNKWASSTDQQIRLVDRTGYVRVNPWQTVIYVIDSRPVQIPLANSVRVMEAQLVQFRKEGVTQFVSIHGARDYDENALKDLLMGYAYEEPMRTNFGGKSRIQYLEDKYKFLKIIKGSMSSQLETPVANDTLHTE